MTLAVRDASLEDAAAITAIYNAARTGVVSFDTEIATVEETREDLRTNLGRFPAVVVQAGGDVVAFASTAPYRPHPCYDGVADFSVYVAPAAQRRGAGRLALATLLERASAAGLHKLLSRIIVDNVASRALCASFGFREVGVYERHGRVDGVWRDCVIVERLVREVPRR
ncbi:MAG: N-acetyltransferase [Candidatus Eremiobacteraeota bacterium]|nr:N-acetyltransferase [Candidatus Eremiobacteraeota bacterium]